MPRGISKFYLVIIITVILIVAGVVFMNAGSKDESKFEYVSAEMNDLVQKVSVTGNVSPVDNVDLSFEVIGRIDMVLAEVGDSVKQGDPLVKLVNSELSAQLAQTKSEIDTENARLKQLDAAMDLERAVYDEFSLGNREEDIRISQRTLDNAINAKSDSETDLNNAQLKADNDLQNLYDDAFTEVNDAYIAIDDAVFIKTDDMFKDRYPDKGDLDFIASDNLSNANARSGRNDSATAAERLAVVLSNFPTDYDQIDVELNLAEADLMITQNFLFVLTQALADAISIDATNKATFQANVDAARDSVVLAKAGLVSLMKSISSQNVTNQKNLDSAESSLNVATNAVLLAQDQLSLKEAGTLPEKLASQQARIDQAQANIEAQKAKISATSLSLDIILSKIEKTVLRTPIDGIVTAQNAKVGEISTLQDPISASLVSIISENIFEVIANIPEVDIAHIVIDNIANITLDAYGPDHLFLASVYKIDPAEIIIDGVPTYKVKLLFIDSDKRIKSGMTANIDIVTDKRSNVLSVPQRSIITKNGEKIIRVASGDSYVEKNVELGLVSWDGQVEILGGLSQGDHVITFIEE